MSRLVAVAGTVVGDSGHASVTVKREDGPELYTAWASADAARRIDQEQYDREQGPCFEAMRTGAPRQVVLAGGSDWPELADAAAAWDVRSVLSTPMCTDETVIGALNVYSPRSEPFGEQAQTLATELAGVASALLTVEMQTAPDRQAETALARTTVAMAQGAVMAWQGCGPEEALAILRRTAVREDRPLLEGAEQVLARARQTHEGEEVAAADQAAATVDDVFLVEAMSRLPRRLLNASSSLEPDDLAVLVRQELRRCGVDDAAIYLVDYEQGVLVPVPPAPGSAIDVDGTLAGRAFQSERPVARRNELAGWTLWLPLLDGAERLGVFQLSTSFLSDDVLREASGITAAVAELVVSKMRYGDALGLVRRTARMTLSAEMRWSVLPPLTFAGDRVGIACVLEPAYDVAGDAFDYSVNAGMLHLAIIDAMGHGLEATRMANLALGAYRFSRRRGFDLANSYRAIDDAIATQFGDEHYVTGQLVTLDLATGLLRWLCAGHPPALVLRRGRLAAQLSAEPCLPLGLGHEPLAPAESSLEPGDHLLFFTDGVPEARSPGGERFGEERLIDLTIRALADQQTLAETVRRLVRSVQAHREGPLGDDATVLLVAWNGVASLASSRSSLQP